MLAAVHYEFAAVAQLRVLQVPSGPWYLLPSFPGKQDAAVLATCRGEEDALICREAAALAGECCSEASVTLKQAIMASETGASNLAETIWDASVGVIAMRSFGLTS
jgi:hypothetical protein